MTDVVPTRTKLNADPTAALFTWAAVGNGVDGAAISMVGFADMCVTMDGTFGTGGSCTLQGSNDGTNFYALTDPQGNAITKTAAGIEQVTETPLYIRPSVTAGDGTTAIDISLLLRKVVR